DLGAGELLLEVALPGLARAQQRLGADGAGHRPARHEPLGGLLPLLGRELRKGQGEGGVHGFADQVPITATTVDDRLPDAMRRPDGAQGAPGADAGCLEPCREPAVLRAERRRIDWRRSLTPGTCPEVGRGQRGACGSIRAKVLVLVRILTG